MEVQLEQPVLTGELSILVDQDEPQNIIQEVTPEGKGYAINKLIKSKSAPV